MAKISLRAYLKEIDSLIDRGENAEAIAHCKYLLKIYPKYIPTYGLLGKAYLESQRYSEALDIFQRVLSVYPDDFIAHLSLSIIREGEDNLDAAIFHMERAYEVQPATPGIQNELRRLYGRRDGAIPPRVRLTRGALVRMYERGELYRQAIAEIRAALAENPDRLDLKVILCRNFFLAGQKVEAADTASQLIAKLPYCFEANRILAEILPATSRAEDAAQFKKRVLELDPYYGFTPLSSPTSSHVPENNVQLDMLDAQMGVAYPSTDTGWAQNLGISLPGPSQESDLPDWFNTSPEPPALENQDRIAIPDKAAAAPEDESDIPDFIRQAGFSPSTGPEVPTTLESLDNDEIDGGEAVASSSIPDWLQSLAPETPPVGESSPSEDDSWFAGLMQASTPDAPQPEAQFGEADDGLSIPSEEGSEPLTVNPDLPDWLKEEPLEGEEAQPSNLPDWLAQPPVMPERNELADESQLLESAAEWQRDMGVELTPPPQEQSALNVDQYEELPEALMEQTPEWLNSLSDTALPPAENRSPQTDVNPAQDAEETPIEDLPEWMKDIAPSTAEELPGEEPSTIADEEAAPAEAAEETPVEDLPDWMTEIAPPTAEELPGEEPSTIADEEAAPAEAAEETPVEDLPEWFTEVTPAIVPDGSQDFTQEVEEDSPLMDEAIPADLPEWLTDIESTLPPAAESEADAPAMDFAATHDEIISSPSAEGMEEDGEAEAPTSESSGEEIESLEPEIPEQIGEPLLSMEQLEQETQAPTQPVNVVRQPDLEPEPEPVEAEEPSPLADFELPSLTSEETIGISETETEQADDLLPSETEELEEILQVDSEVMDRMESHPAEQTPPVSAPLSTEMPDDLEAALAWMEALAARQGAIEGTLSAAKDELSTEMPDWLQREVENAPEQPPLPADVENATPAVAEESVMQSESTDEADLDSLEPAVEISQFTEEETSIEIETSLPTIEPPVMEMAETAENEEIEPEPAPQPQVETPGMQSPEAPSEILPDSSLEEEQPELTEVELPDWLKGIDQTTPEPALGLETGDARWVREEIEEIPLTETTEPPSEPAFTPSPTTDEELQASQVPEAGEPLLPEPEIPQTPPARDGWETSPSPWETLQKAQKDLRRRDLESAAAEYEQLVASGDLLEETIHDLREAIDRHPMQIELYQVLGDAYLRNNQLQAAIDAYTKAEQLLR